MISSTFPLSTLPILSIAINPAFLILTSWLSSTISLFPKRATVLLLSDKVCPIKPNVEPKVPLSVLTLIILLIFILFISFGYTPVTDLNIWPFLSFKLENDMTFSFAILDLHAAPILA